MVLSICLCLANYTHLGFLACSHMEGDVQGVFFFNFTCRVKNSVWRAQWCSFSSAVKGTSAGSLGFSGSSWWGWEEKEGAIREMKKRTVRFFTSYSWMVCCSLGGCWRAGELFQNVWSFHRDSIYAMTLCLGFWCAWCDCHCDVARENIFFIMHYVCSWQNSVCLRWNYSFSGVLIR